MPENTRPWLTRPSSRGARLVDVRVYPTTLDERGMEAYDQIDYAAKSVLVLGGEGGRLHEQVRKNCHVLVRIPGGQDFVAERLGGRRRGAVRMEAPPFVRISGRR
jgi:hypothetical protein